MKTNSYSVNMTQCMHPFYYLLKLKQACYPEMATLFFQKGTMKCTELFKQGFMIPQHAAAVTDMNRSPETKSKFRFKLTAEQLHGIRLTFQFDAP